MMDNGLGRAISAEVEKQLAKENGNRKLLPMQVLSMQTTHPNHWIMVNTHSKSAWRWDTRISDWVAADPTEVAVYSGTEMLALMEA
jgi:hypothetical protein